MVDLVVTPHDTPIDLSRSVFTSPAAWREIARLNRLRDPDRIYPGQLLHVPQRLLKASPRPARIVAASGDATITDANGTRRAQPGELAAEGARIEAPAGGSVVVALADGSRMKLMPGSVAELEQSRAYGARTESATATGQGDGWFAGTMRLINGTLETAASKVRRARPLDVETQTAVIGVRGTEFRVGAGNGSAAPPSGSASAAPTSRVEVLEGVVRAGTSAKVRAGFGASFDASGKPSPPRPLPKAPDLSGVPTRFERPVVRFAAPAADAPLRVQVAQDEAFDRVVSDQRVPAGGEARIAGLPDGDWWLRARRVDDAGIEGFDAKRAFVLKARPEPPATTNPRPSSKVPAGPVDFAWAANLDARRYELQVARDPQFKDLAADLKGLSSTSARVDIAETGALQWRVASIGQRPDGSEDRGPWGDAQRFEVRPLPEPPKGGLNPDGRLVLTWGGRPEDRYQVELARDAAFTQVVDRAELASAQWALKAPDLPGAYYFRYRSVELDGWVSPPSSTLAIEVPRDLRWLWLLLAPLAALL